MSSENNKNKQEKQVKQLKRKDKQFLIVSDKTNNYFRDLKKKIKEKYGVAFTYNKIVEKMIKCVDKEKFDEELKRID